VWLPVQEKSGGSLTDQQYIFIGNNHGALFQKLTADAIFHIVASHKLLYVIARALIIIIIITNVHFSFYTIWLKSCIHFLQGPVCAA